MKRLSIWFVLLPFLLLVGCSRLQPVYNVSSSPIPASLTQEQVKRAIMEGGIHHGWRMVEKEPGVIAGEVDERHLVAKILVKYDKTHYSITYVDSKNLDYAKGKIHPTYNRWVQSLNREIQKRLQLASLK